MPCQRCAFLIAAAAVRGDVTCVWCGVVWYGEARGVYCTLLAVEWGVGGQIDIGVAEDAYI
jgi:hypothetical protein